MKHTVSIIVLALGLVTLACSPTVQADRELNLDFEEVLNGMPQGWSLSDSKRSDYSVSIDSLETRSGKYSILIKSVKDSVVAQALALKLPGNYDGKRITLSGYIKTENVVGEYAGLCMSIDSRIAQQNGITGSTEWTRYEVSSDMDPSKTRQIVIGGLLVGKGKMWLDDLRITIDGRDIGKARLYEPQPFPADSDIEFDRGSGIVLPVLDERQTKDLELLGRIWGFLKYHHPAIAKGGYNWDYELFRILPSYVNAKDDVERDKILLRWIKQYGRLPKCKTCVPTQEDAYIKPDLSWIDNSEITPNIKNLLHNIYINRNQGDHFYINTSSGAGNPVFPHEKSYDAMPFPDAGYRLLALYRYWNMINYFFPYKYMTDKNWNVVLGEYIPFFLEAENELDYELIIARLIGEVCDSHGFLSEGWDKIESLKGDGQILASVGFVEDKLTVTEYYTLEAETAQLKRGDVITHIEGRSVESVVDSMRKYYPASNEAARMRDIARDILRSPKHTLTVDYISSSGRVRQQELYLGTRDQWMYFRYRRRRDETSANRCYRFIGREIGYITLECVSTNDIPIIMNEFKNTKGLIIDIRNYPSASVLYNLGAYFVSDTTPFVRFTNGNSNNPGEFTLGPEYLINKSERDGYSGKVVVLVNEETQSAAELHAMAFGVGENVSIIGSQTAGANGNFSTIILPGGLSTIISGLGVYYPNGTNTQRAGVRIDHYVEPTIEGIKAGRDEVLEKALEIIEGKT